MSERSYVCSTCKGTVSIPKGRKVWTIEQVREHHDVACPRPGRK